MLRCSNADHRIGCRCSTAGKCRCNRLGPRDTGRSRPGRSCRRCSGCRCSTRGTFHCRSNAVRACNGRRCSRSDRFRRSSADRHKLCRCSRPGRCRSSPAAPRGTRRHHSGRSCRSRPGSGCCCSTADRCPSNRSGRPDTGMSRLGRFCRRCKLNCHSTGGSCRCSRVARRHTGRRCSTAYKCPSSRFGHSGRLQLPLWQVLPPVQWPSLQQARHVPFPQQCWPPQ